MPQAHTPLSFSHPSVEQVADAINAMIAERAAERLQPKVPATEPGPTQRNGLEVLKPDVMREVRQAAASITLNPHLARAFQGGVPEVSVFWSDEHGIACKCRLDWLKPRTIVDIKKCANVRERPFDVAVLLAIAAYRYDVSARHYLDGFRHLYQFAAEGRIFGACPLKPGWHRRIAPPDAMCWTWVFHQTEGAPVTKGLELLPASSALHPAAREIVQAKQTYRECLEKFATTQWVSDTRKVMALSVHDQGHRHRSVDGG